MRRCAATLVLVLLGCNAGDRGEGPLSGSAGLSAGESAEASGGGGASETGDSADPSGMGSNAEASAGTTGDSGNEAASASATDGSITGGSETGSAQTGDTGGLDTDGGSESTGDLADGVLDIVVTAYDDCTFTTDPASITVPEGMEFTVNWVSSAASEVEFDVAKIDAFNAVPIILGMEPGTSYHDDIREWCGDLFTGTFDFRVTSCYEHHYIPVDCGG